MNSQMTYIRLGAVDVQLSCDVPQILDDYLELYEHHACNALQEFRLHLAISSRRSKPWARREYYVQMPGREHVIGTEIRAGLPDVEALINQEVIRHYRQFLQLHACVMEYNGQGVLLPADSGTGKSSLAAGLIQRGWRYLSDELALIDSRTRVVHPFPKALCIKESGFELLDSMGLNSAQHPTYLLRGRYPRLYLNPADVRPDCLGRPCQVRWCFFLARKGANRPWLRQPTTGETAMYMYRAGLNTLAHHQQGLDATVGLAQQTDCFILHLAEMNDNLDLLEDILANGPDKARAHLRVA